MIYEREFLELLDTIPIRTTYARITLLDFNENPIKEIQGTLTGGTLNINGSAAVRRTISLTMLADEEVDNIENLNNLISLNKKFKIEIGIKIPFSKWRKLYGDIAWFKQGIFIISSANISRSTNAYSISINANDKMAQLNGVAGGTIPFVTDFHIKEKWDDTEKKYVQEWISYYQIIQEAVHHFGGEPVSNIYILGLPDKAKKLQKFIGKNSKFVIYLARDDTPYTGEVVTVDDNGNFIGELLNPVDTKMRIYEFGENVGYTETDFTPSKDTPITLNGGETVVALLDKIKNILGNYEYFYDVDGHFIFQEQQNYLNTSSANVNLLDFNVNDYFKNYSNQLVEYTFTDYKTMSSINQNPKYDNIKNDFVINGKRTSSNSITIPIMYHVVIDKVPEVPADLSNDLYLTSIDYSFDGVNFDRIAIDTSSSPVTDEEMKLGMKPDPNNEGELVEETEFDWIDKIQSITGSSNEDRICIDDELWLGDDTTLGYRTKLQDSLKSKIKNLNYDIKEAGKENKVEFTVDLPNEFYTDPDRAADAAYIDYLADIKQILPPLLNNSAESLALSNTIDSIIDFLKDYQFNYEFQKKSLSEEETIQDYFPNQGIYPPKTVNFIFDSYYIKEEIVYKNGILQENSGTPAGRPYATNIIVDNWREYLYQEALIAKSKGMRHSRYDEELLGFWRDVYDPTNPEWFSSNFYTPVLGLGSSTKNKDLSSLNYWIDFVEPGDPLAQYSVSRIGARTKVVNDDKIQTIYNQYPEDIVFFPSGSGQLPTVGTYHFQIKPEWEELFQFSSTPISCFDKIRELIYTHFTYNTSITIQCTPRYYLEPNQLIALKFEEEDYKNSITNNKYAIASMSIPLTYNGMMSLSLTQALQRG